MEHNRPTQYRFLVAPPLLSMRFCAIYPKRGRIRIPRIRIKERLIRLIR
jgi:hypothetical protein